MTAFHVNGIPLVAGAARATLVLLRDTLSFWGGFDPQTGTVIDQHHPDHGISIRQSILALPGSRGSAGTPAGIAESLRLKTGPVGIILAEIDVNIMIGARVAEHLYGHTTPVVVLDQAQYRDLQTMAGTANPIVSITRDGQVSAELTR